MKSRWASLTRGLIIGACAALIGACASPFSTEFIASDADEIERHRAEAVFEIGLAEIVARYIDPLTAERLALAGLSSLHRLDPAVDITRTADAVSLSLNGDVRARADAPSVADSTGWARLLAQFADQARRSSPLIGATQWEGIYEAVFDTALDELDPFSRYLSAEKARDQRASRDGTGGIGLHVRHDAAGKVVVADLLPSGPAASSGLAVGDRITRIDGEPVAGLTLAAIVHRFEGPAGTRVVVTTHGSGADEERDFAISRVHIVPETVSIESGDGVVVVRVRGFNQGTAGRLWSLLDNAVATGGGVKGIVLDLRGNPGGLLHQSVRVANMFLRQGPIVTTHGRHPDSLQIFDADASDLVAGLPVVVIIDGGSASAAEIVAAALQDRHRAVVIGATSYGKGTVQMIIPLPNRGELTLTWSQLLPPSGQVLHGHGVVPSICTSGVDEDGTAAVERVVRSGPLPPEDRWRCPAERRGTEFELDVARRVLADGALYARALSPHATVAAALH